MAYNIKQIMKNMKDIGKMIKNMEKEFYIQQMVKLKMVFGKMMYFQIINLKKIVHRINLNYNLKFKLIKLIY